MNTTAKVNGNDLRRAIKSALSIVVKNPSLHIVENVLLAIQENRLTIEAENTEAHYTMTIDARTEGYTEYSAIHYEDIKRILNIKGDEITVEINAKPGENTVTTFSDNKKSMGFKTDTIDYAEQWINSFVDGNTEQLYTIDADDLIKTLERCKPFTAKHDMNPLMKGYCINGTYIEALDGYHAIRCNMPGMIYNTEQHFVINPWIDNVKNIFTKTETIIFSYYNDKFVSLVAENGKTKITYNCRIMQGQPFPLDQAIPKSNGIAEMNINANDLKAICKEAASYTKKEKMPIHFYANNGRGIISLAMSNFKYAEKFYPNSYTGAEMYSGYKAAYMLDGLNAFDGDVTIHYYGNLQAMVIEQNGDITLVLPVRLETSRKDALEKAIA